MFPILLKAARKAIERSGKISRSCLEFYIFWFYIILDCIVLIIIFWEFCMAILIKLSNKIVAQAKTISKQEHRSIDEQIEHWVKIGKIVEENPDLTYEFIQKLLITRKESQTGNIETYKFDD